MSALPTMASAALPIFGAIGTSVSLLNHGLTIFKEYKAIKEIEPHVDEVHKLYQQVKRDLTRTKISFPNPI
eukprot:IDg5416t1